MNQNIICVSSIDWDFLWQQHQELMSAYAKQGSTVLFIENTGVRTPKFKDMPRVVKRIKNWLKGTKGFRKEMDNLYVYSPLFLPFPYSRIARFINRKIIISAVKNWMKSVGFYEPIIWSFLPTYLTLDIAKNIEHKLLVYYCTDNFSATSLDAKKITKIENSVIRLSDLVFVMSLNLTRHCRKFNQHVFRVPMGVNLERFTKVRQASIPRPKELLEINAPIIGYVGGIRHSLDQELIRRLAEELKDCVFVFVGPIQTKVAILKKSKNIILVEAKEHKDIPGYIKHFDCCIIPYVKDGYTDNISPAKLNEYLIMGKPVVSTDLSGVRDFNQEFGEVVEIAVDHAEFIKKVRAAIEEHDSSLASKRIAVAEGNSWDKKIEFISQKINAALVDKSIEVKVSWQENLLNLYRHNRRRAAKIFLAGIFIYAVLFYTPLIWFLAEPLKISQSPQKADAIVVFAGGAGESGKAGQGYEEKVEYAVELYKKGLAKNFIFSSGYSYHFKEPLIMQALAVSLGVPREAIILEEKANSTYTNVIFTKAILDQRGWKTILLVSSPYHMRRVALVMKRIAPELEVIFTPPPVSIFYRHGVTADGDKTFRQLKPVQLKALLHEYLGIIYYWLKGRV